MFVDSHAHIDGPEYDADRAQVLERARAVGIIAVLTVGAGDPASGALERAVQLAEDEPMVYAAVGIHPHEARLFDEAAAARLGRLIRHPKAIAWGEIGLDYHYDNSPRDVQRRAFAAQLKLAREAGKPVIIHSREADEDTLAILRDELSRDHGGVMHCFTGGWRAAEAALDLGMMISFAGILTFKRADELRAIAREVPLDRVLIETDSPYLAPVPYRGRRNEPAYVIEVARALAVVRGLSVEEIGRRTTENFTRLFRLHLEGFRGAALDR
ncbi:MAG: TatD family hydrolase [Pyrinomonas methylaliphatogenes]|nr:TatD family hydrolase [Pyrinomonas methylaliphatogenes]